MEIIVKIVEWHILGYILWFKFCLSLTKFRAILKINWAIFCFLISHMLFQNVKRAAHWIKSHQVSLSPHF
jgi:hypothetical protein